MQARPNIVWAPFPPFSLLDRVKDCCSRWESRGSTWARSVENYDVRLITEPEADIKAILAA
jgi:hypothetical protein